MTIAPDWYDVGLTGGQAPAATEGPKGYWERLAMALHGMQAPGGEGRAGDVFGANLLYGLGQGFSAPKVHQIGERQKALDLSRTQFQAGETERRARASKTFESTLPQRPSPGGEPLERVVGPDGKPVLLPRSKASGMAPAGEAPKPTRPVTLAMAKDSNGALKVGDLIPEDEWLLRSRPRAPKDERLVQVMRNGVPTWIRESEAVGQPAAQASRAITGQERQALSYYNRGRQAIAAIDTPDEAGTTLEQKMATMNLGGQAQLRYAPNVIQTPEQRMYRQAQRSFTEARLRKESGAAIPPHEYENDSKTYFAQPGDDPLTIAQKRLLRAGVLEGLGYSSGKAYEEYYGEPFQPSGRGTAPSVTTPGPSSASPAPVGAIRGKFERVNGKLVRVR